MGSTSSTTTAPAADKVLNDQSSHLDLIEFHSSSATLGVVATLATICSALLALCCCFRLWRYCRMREDRIRQQQASAFMTMNPLFQRPAGPGMAATISEVPMASMEIPLASVGIPAPQPTSVRTPGGRATTSSLLMPW